MFKISKSLIYTSRVRFNSTSSSTAGPLYDGFLNSLRTDLKACIRNKLPPIEKTTVRGILSEMKNLEIENHGSIVDEFKIYDHLNKLVKQRKETANEYLKPDQPERFKELAEKELSEAKIIEKYLNSLPVATEDEIKTKLRELMKSENITDKRKLFPKIPWAKINTEWRASKGAVSNAINNL